MDKIRRKALEGILHYFGPFPEGTTPNDAFKCAIEEFGGHADRGYVIGYSGEAPAEKDFLVVMRIDVLDVYDSDIEAARQAEKDGVRLIPYNEQVRKGYLRHYRFVDCEENRNMIQKWRENPNFC